MTDREIQELKQELSKLSMAVREMTQQLRYIVDVHDEEIFGKDRWKKLKKAAKTGVVVTVKMEAIKKRL